MARNYQTARPIIVTLLKTLRLPNIGAITPRQLNRLYRSLGWESDDMEEERKGKKNLLMWIRKNVDGMDVEKGSKVGWDRKVDDSVCLRREEESHKDHSGEEDGDDTDGDDGYCAEEVSKTEQDGRKSGGENGKISADLLDVHNNNDILTPGWDPSSATTARLRNILTTYCIAFPSSANKSALVELVTVKLLPMINHLRQQNAHDSRSSREGEDVRNIENEDVSNRSKDERRRQVQKRQKCVEVVDLCDDSRIPSLAEDVDGTTHVAELDVMEDLQHDVPKLPQDNSLSERNNHSHHTNLSQHNNLYQTTGPHHDDTTLQAQLARATQNRDELIEVCLAQQQMVTVLREEMAKSQTQLQFTFSQAQNEVEQLRKEKLDLEVRLESTAHREPIISQVELNHLYKENADLQNRLETTIQSCDEEKADLQNQLKTSIQRCDEGKAKLQNQLISSIQRHEEHTDLQARLQKQLETAEANYEHRHATMQDRLDQLQSTIDSQAADLSVLRTKDNVDVASRSTTWDALPILGSKGPEKDVVAPLHAILVTVLQRARAGKFIQCLDSIGDTMKIVIQMSQRSAMQPGQSTEEQALEEKVAEATGTLSSAV